MLVFCLKNNKDTESVNSKVLKTKIGRPFLSSKCAVHSSKKWRFVKEQDDSSERKPNKIWVDQGSEMHSTYNEWKSVVAERCIKTLRNKILSICMVAGPPSNFIFYGGG